MKRMETLYGIHPVREAIRAGRREIRSIMVLSGKLPERLQEIRDIAEERGFPLKTTSEEHLRSMAGTGRHQGVAVEVSPYEPVGMETLLRAPDRDSTPPFYLVADSITDPMNLGALIRTALSVGVRGVITPRDRCAPPTPVVANASAGALEHIRLAQVVNLVRALQELKNQGVWVFGLDHRAREDCFHTDLAGPSALVVGSEGKGIRPLVKKACDHLVAIPQEGSVSSLNASVAGAVVMYEAYRQRTAA